MGVNDRSNGFNVLMYHSSSNGAGHAAHGCHIDICLKAAMGHFTTTTVRLKPIYIPLRDVS